MAGAHVKTYPFLLPLAWLYGVGVRLRNYMFDVGILPQRTFSIPIISVGNITVGGTGKTPHTEYLIRLLADHYQVAVLSRGYRRKSRGYRLAGSYTAVEDIGDEPYQMKRKFPCIYMAVDADRCRGISNLMRFPIKSQADVILLDDAYQHRYVRPSLNILLVDYNRPIYHDLLLPAGRLREPIAGIRRADVVIVSKCPPDISDAERADIAHRLQLRADQQLFFTYLRYPQSLPSFSIDPLLVTGIASPQPLVEHLRQFYPNLKHLAYPDHHIYTKRDLAHIRHEAGDRQILTTDKDASRLPMIYNSTVSVEVAFLDNTAEQFNNIIEQICTKRFKKQQPTSRHA